RSTVGRPASSQSTASTFGPLEPGPLPPPALALPGAIWEPLRLEQVVSASRTRGDAEARTIRRELHAVHELDARPRVFADQQVSVQVDVVEERGDVGSRGDCEAGLDHATEHQAEAERARGRGH